jgi:hypothetical protein
MADHRPTSGDEIADARAVVELYVRELDQLFDSMDPAPFHEKGLDPDAEEYIVSYFKELPTRPTALVVYLDKPVGLPDEGKVLGDAIRKHFAWRAQLLRWKVRRLIHHGLISLMIGLVVLAAAISAGGALTHRLGGGHFAEVLALGLQIGGWVAMTQPLQILLYEWWPIVGEIRLYEMLSKMPVKIVYTAGEASPASSSNTQSSSRRNIDLVPGSNGGRR